MILVRKYLSVVIVLVLFIHCNTNQEEVTSAYSKFYFGPPIDSSLLTIHPTSYLGEWSHNIFLYTSELVIKDNGSFTFHERGCLGHRYSEGKWSYAGTNIILNSFPQYAARNYHIGSYDTANTYFHNVFLRLDGDNLYQLDSSGFRTDAKYVMVKRNH